MGWPPGSQRSLSKRSCAAGISSAASSPAQSAAQSRRSAGRSEFPDESNAGADDEVILQVVAVFHIVQIAERRIGVVLKTVHSQHQLECANAKAIQLIEIQHRIEAGPRAVSADEARREAKCQGFVPAK